VREFTPQAWDVELDLGKPRPMTQVQVTGICKIPMEISFDGSYSIQAQQGLKVFGDRRLQLSLHDFKLGLYISREKYYNRGGVEKKMNRDTLIIGHGD